MGEAFFLGTMAELGGSIFVERRHRAKITEDTKVMADTLRDGFHVMIYPEGTSGDGQKILPFKKSLLISAVEGQRDILPVVTKYIEIDGEPFGPENCHKVCWYGDMGFAPHFMGVLGLKKVKVELHFLEPIQVTPQSSRHELAEKCRSAIESVDLSDRASRTSAI
jgi:1-acyl-sn-glycerol-3-phosphate acyltransferase